MNKTIDVTIINLSVHGGRFHNLIHFHEMLINAGVDSHLIFNIDPPLGLQIGIDLDEDDISKFEKKDVYFFNNEQILNYVKIYNSKLFFFDSHEDNLNQYLIKFVKDKYNSQTAQFSTLIDDFAYWNSDYVFLTSAFSLWCLLNVRDYPNIFSRAKNIYFNGSLFYEPLCNSYTTTVSDKKSFYHKYGFDETKPTALFLPNRIDGESITYLEIIKTIKSSGYNLALKLHPWEYKSIKHGFDTNYGKNLTSADKWDVKPIEEKDSTWAYQFCRVAIGCGSSGIIEFPAWNKPVILFNKDKSYDFMQNWISYILNECSIEVNNIRELHECLTGKYFQISKSNYSNAIDLIFPVGPLNSFQLHLKHVLSILNGSEKSFNSMDKERMKKMYKSDLTIKWKRFIFKYKIQNILNTMRKIIKKQCFICY